MTGTNNILRHQILFLLLLVPFTLFGQKITIIATDINGTKDTVQFGFVDQATIGEDPTLGEYNLFGTPVDEYEVRILQRDEENHECTLLEVNGSEIYYPENFDSKINFRSAEDTSLANRLFEVWFSDHTTDSLKIMSEVNIKGFLNGYQYLYVCDDTLHHSPVGILVVEDEVYTLEYKVAPGHWPKDFVFVILPQDVTTSTEDEVVVSHEIKILPNPATSEFVVQRETGQITKIVIQNLDGQILETIHSPHTRQEISIQSFVSGLYVVHVWFDNGPPLVTKVLKL